VTVREERDFWALEGAVRRLAERSPAATPFQTWEWLSAWRAHTGKRARLIPLVFEEAGEVVGVAPLTVTGGPLKTLSLMGRGGSDYLDFLAAPGRERAVAASFGEWLTANQKRWDWLALPEVRPESVVGQIPGVEVWEAETCPYLPLEATWEAQTKVFGKKLRGNLSYYERALGKAHTLTLRVATAETLEADMAAFFALHQKRWRGRYMPGAFASERARAFHLAAARGLLAAGALRLHLLDLDGVTQAALYCFHKSPRTCYYLGGFEPSLAKFSLGTVLTGRAIRHAIETDGAQEFDFLRGDEPYKYKWGALDRHNRRLSRTSGVAGGVLAALGKKRLMLELALKHRMHAAHGGEKKKP
jgi:CelD/BcsL family acetyltransferase involved in cellulose biosynthesis